MKKEIVWKTIPFEPNYEVSTTGLVRNKKTQKVLALLNRDKVDHYLRVHLSRKKYLVHRLVMLTFDPDNEKDVVNHKDENKHNNNIDNLEWMTRSENVIFSIQKNNRYGENSCSNKLSRSDVYEIKYNINLDHSKTARLYNVHRQTIRDIRNGKRWSDV